MKQVRTTKTDVVDSPERYKAMEGEQLSTSSFSSILQLQRLAGNRAVTDLFESDGPSLTHAPVGIVQRKCATCTATSKCSSCEEEERLERKPKNASTSLRIQRAPNNEASESLIVGDDADQRSRAAWKRE